MILIIVSIFLFAFGCVMFAFRKRIQKNLPFISNPRLFEVSANNPKSAATLAVFAMIMGVIGFVIYLAFFIGR